MNAMFGTLGAALVLAASAAHAAPCDGAEHRQFDFWVGEWNVTRPDGKPVGTNSITREYGGCVIHEHYATPRGYAGESLNTWNADRGVWHQTWVDSGGTLLLLEGKLVGGAMVLEGDGKNEGRPVKHRITWTPNADGSVRQLWESSGASGQWTTVFDGVYRRRS